MYSSKKYTANGNSRRFMSEYIIKSDQHARVYAYIYDASLLTAELQDPTSVWSYPSNLYKRPTDVAEAEDVVSVDKWDLIDNSIVFYTKPNSGTTIFLETSANSEDFGTTMAQPGVARAEEAALRAEADAALARQYSIQAALGGGAGQFLGLAETKAVQYSAQESPDTMTLFEGLNGLAVDSFTLLEGAEFIIEDGAVFKVV